MSQLTIRGCAIRKATQRCSNEGAVVQEIHIEADWSETVAEEMKWTPKPEGFGNGALTTKLSGHKMMMEPNSGKLKDYRFEIGIDQADSFKHVAVMEEGEVTGHKLRFRVKTTAEDVHLVLNEWFKNVGPSDSLAQCKITYSADEQMKIGEAATDGFVEPPAETEKPRGRKREAVQ